MTEPMMGSNSPVFQGPSDKEKKYDRQLRLWAASGQQALEDANLLLINSGSGTVGVETLKNLVLPGIGMFTIADAATVTEVDLGVNFFLDEESLGKSRAECCVNLLKELNPDVRGESISLEKGKTVANVLGEHKYTLIFYTFPIDAESLALVHKYSNEHKIPLIAIHSAGFYSYFRIYLHGNFPIVDTHPDSTATTDLRLLTPWDELSTFAADLTKDIENLSAHEHGHIPYVAILLHYLTKWKDEHGSLPTTYKDKTAFRAFVADGARTNTPEGGEENFDEAVSAVLKTITYPALSSAVKEVFDYQPNEMEANSNFWIIASAVKKFYMDHHVLPLPGSVPDMKAQSTIYVQLQSIYKAKARQDVSEVLETVQNHPKGKDIEPSEVENFCKNAAFIKLIRSVDSTTPVPDITAISNREFESDENAPMTLMPLSLIPIYLALNATSHIPTGSAIHASNIVENISNASPGLKLNTRVTEVAQEVARANGGELHNIAALTGGMVAQEAIKIITKQYIPIDNTCIFDGITSRTQILRI